MNEQIILKIENLSKKFGSNQVLKNVCLEVAKGDIYGILGLSGAGKSTLVRCINGLEQFDEGTITFNGEVVNFDRNYRRQVAMIFQQFNLLDQRTVLKNVMLA
ncbi:MAG: amino acid ABC transporter ATP-binding protein, partial [Clostridia bacterium]|nr:amino acid ABC transporter ATP-binding protein [Clostridia bacterium]